MVAPQPVFQNIAEEITRCIQKADSEILVNVPWFTDQSLFEQLRLKARVGVAVSIGIEDDSINEKASFQHADIVKFGGRLYLHQTRGVWIMVRVHQLTPMKQTLEQPYNLVRRARCKREVRKHRLKIDVSGVTNRSQQDRFAVETET